MKKTIVPMAVVFISLMCCIWVFRLAMEYPPGRPVGRASYWPEGLGQLVDRENRVHGFFVNASDFFYFTGDVNAFNEFLEQYAMLKDTPLRLVLHAGRGMAGSPWDEDKEIPFEWQVSAFGWGWPEEKYPEVPATDETESVVMMDLWLGGRVELDEVKVPLNVEVKSGGEIERFTATHEARRQAQNLPDQ